MAKALLVLIAKIEKPVNIKHFRPISLCNVAFKLITKVVANRLKWIMGDVVAPNQSSFVPKSQISDNIFICQELIHSLKSKTGRRGDDFEDRP